MVNELDPRPRVSIAERLIPAFALGVAAVAGAAGAWRMISFFQTLRHDENAGMAALLGGIAEIEWLVGALLAFAAVLGIIGVLVAVVRTIVATRTVSSSPWVIVAMAIVGLFPPVLLAGCIGMMLAALREPPKDGLTDTGATVATLLLISIGGAVFAMPILIALSLVPFRGPAPETDGLLGLIEDENAALQSPRTANRLTTLIVIILVEAAIVSLSAWYFMEMFASRREMMIH